MPEASSHLENFSLKDVNKLSGLKLEERIRALQPLYQVLESVYEREIATRADREVTIIDNLTGKPRRMLMFGSNNYLGFASHPYIAEKVIEAVRQYGSGIGGPPLLNGTTGLHKRLRAKLIDFKKVEDVILFSSGFSANLAWTSALLEEKDIIFFDEYNHASFHAGLSMVKAKKIPFRHNQTDDLRRKIRRYGDPDSTQLIMVEGVYSMDGDVAPLDQVVKIAKDFNCKVIVDDAHGTGVIGERGFGTVDYFGIDPNDIFIHMGTFSKTLGVNGGFLGGKSEVIRYLRMTAKPYIFSASFPAHVAAAVIAGIELIERDHSLTRQLQANARYLVDELRKHQINTGTDSAIVPILIPPKKDVRAICQKLNDRGIFLNSVEYPAVPLNKQRLRVSVMATHTKADLDKLVEELCAVFHEEGITFTDWP